MYMVTSYQPGTKLQVKQEIVLDLKKTNLMRVILSDNNLLMV